MDVVILAGGEAEHALQIQYGIKFRASLPAKGKTMVELVADAVQHLGEPILVGEAQLAGVRHVPAGNSFILSLANGLEAVQTDQFLMVTADLPFLGRAAVDDFVRRSDPTAALNYPIIPVARCESEFPGMKRTTLRLAEGVFTGGNVAVVNTQKMRRLLPNLELAYANRKSPLKLASQVGAKTLFALLWGRFVPSSLSIRKLEQNVSKMLGGPVRGVITEYASIGTDIDNAEQYQLARTYGWL